MTTALEPRIGSLFAGYGGLEIGVQTVLGGVVAWHSEIDPGASLILAHHWPDVPNHGDITKIEWAGVEPVDVLTGGFPCQDISVAGNRAGLRPGTRSGLWSQFAYAISRLRPRLVVIENVRALVNAPAHSDVEPCPMCMGGTSDGALRALGAVLGDLANLGFDAEWHGLPASAMGAPHGRWREFILAYPAGEPWSLGDGDGGAAADVGGVGALLGTPRVGGYASSAAQSARGSDKGRLEQQVANLLPTPRATDHKDSMTSPGAARHFAAGWGTLSETLGANLLPTPQAQDGQGHSPSNGANRAAQGRQMQLAHAVGAFLDDLLPTPSVADSEGGHVSRSGSRSDELLLPGIVRLLPTPVVGDATGGNTMNNGTPGGTLNSDVKALHGQEWGKYATAIRRWETILGVPAPPPTQPGSKGAPQLSPEFSEWMMGLSTGHVTAPAIWSKMVDKRGKPASGPAKRNAMLKALGNGVVPQQAATALRSLLTAAAGSTHPHPKES